MTDKASPKGWVIQVTILRPGGNQSVQIYDVAIPEASSALETVRRVSGAGLGDIVETIGELPVGTDLRDGEVLLR